MIGLAVLTVIVSGIVLILYRRRWVAAGPRERSFLKTIYLLFPVAGVAFSFLLWLVKQALPVPSISPGVLYLSAYPVLVVLPTILCGRRLAQIRTEEGTP